MKKLLIKLLLLVTILGGFLFCCGRGAVERIAKHIFEDETGLSLTFEDWEIKDRQTLKVLKPKISSGRLLSYGDITAESLLFKIDLSRIISRKLTINEILINGLEIDSPSTESTFFKFIDFIITDSPDPLIKADILSLRGENFKNSKFKFGSATIELKPEKIDFNFSKKEPLVQASAPLDITLSLPSALDKFRKIGGDITVAGNLLSPEIISNLTFQHSSLIQVTASLYRGVLTVRPHVQGNLEAGVETAATGELQLKNLKLVANDFTIKGLPLGSLSPVFKNAKSQVLAQGELNLLNFNGDLLGAVEILNIESLPIALKDLKLELEVSNRDLKISEGSFRGDAGVVELTGGINLESKDLYGQIKTKNLLIKEPDVKARVPRGVELVAAINFSGDLNQPKLSGPIELEFFKLGLTGESSVEAAIYSKLELDLNKKSPMLSHGTWTIQPLGIETQGREIKTVTSVPIEVVNGELQLPSTEVSIGDKKIKIAGKVSKEGYNFSALGSAEIASLVGRKERIDDITGDIAVRLNLTGALDSPRVSGEIDLTGGGFSIPLSGDRFHLEDIAGRATFDDKRIKLEKFQNSSGDARVEMSGEVNDFLSVARSGRIQAKFDQVTVQPDPNLVLHLHADSQLILQPGALPSLKGKIYIDDALYEQRSNLQDLVKKLLGFLVKGSQTATSRQLSSPIVAEIAVTADRGLVVDTDIFQGELSSDLMITGSPQGVKINGAVSGDSGELKLGRNKFDVSLVQVVFNDQELGSLPEFELRADGELGPRGSAEQVQLKILGKLPSPGIQLFSESARSQKELLAELGLGVDKLSVYSNQTRTTPSLVAALNPFSGAGLTDRVGELTGGASIQVESGYSADTGTFAPRLLLEQPLPYTFRLVAQSELSQFNRTEINLEYPLTDQTNIFTGWKNAPTTRNPENLSGSFGVGVHYRERFPGTYVLPGDLLLENAEWILGLSNEESGFDEETHR